MAQEYMILVPELRQYHDLGASIGQFFQDDEADFLVRLLAVPVDPPMKKIVKTTISADVLNRQHRALVRKAYGLPDQDKVYTKANVKCHCQNIKLTVNSSSTTRSVLGYKDQNRIVLNHKFSLDRADKNTTITRPKEKSATVCTCFQDRQESFIEKQFELLQSPTVKLANRLLPEEMKIEIFKHVETQGLVTEGLADPNICGLARYILEKRFKGQLGAWAGNRIVCWGSDNNPGDYPKGSVSNIMTMEFGVNKYSNFMRSGEDDALDTLWGNGSTPTFEEHKDRSSDPKFASLPDLVYNSWIQPDDFDLPKVFQQGWSGNDVDFITGLDGHQITLKESYFYPTDQPWILRNLTTKEYVRADAIALKPDYIHGPFIDNIGFGEVVLFRTIWSSKKDCGLEWDDVSDNDHHRGVWAGHAFDITTVARHEKESKIKKEIWTDVSEEVRKEIRDVFRMERIFWAEL